MADPWADNRPRTVEHPTSPTPYVEHEAEDRAVLTATIAPLVLGPRQREAITRWLAEVAVRAVRGEAREDADEWV